MWRSRNISKQNIWKIDEKVTRKCQKIRVIFKKKIKNMRNKQTKKVKTSWKIIIWKEWKDENGGNFSIEWQNKKIMKY